MSIPERLTNYLDQRGLRYEVRTHELSHTSAECARLAHITPHQLAKPVLLEDDAGCVMAVVPGDRDVHLGWLARMLGRRDLHLCDEERIAMMFADCERGAMPPVGMAWGVETIFDDALEESDLVFMEGGDHESLLQMSHESFHAMADMARHGRICREAMH